MLRFVIFLQLFACCCCSFLTNETINLNTESLLLHFDKLESTEEFQVLPKISNERVYAYTVYYRVLYFRFCHKITNTVKSHEEFDNFCNNLQDYFGDDTQPNESTANLIEDIRNTAKKHKTFGRGIENDHFFEAHITCVSIRDFYHQKLLSFQNHSKIPIKEWIHQPNYTEWFIHAVPFCLPVSCGFTKHAYYNKIPHPTIFDCLPPSYKAAVYIVFCLDGLIVFAIFAANILILIVVPKTNIAHAPHG